MAIKNLIIFGTRPEAIKMAPLVKEFQLKHGRKPKIGLFGLAFKPSIDDLRESPAKYIAQKVLQNSNNEEYFIVEPNIEDHHIFKLTNYKKAFEKSDILAFLVAHDEFKEADLRNDQVVLDFCGVTLANNIN